MKGDNPEQGAPDARSRADDSGEPVNAENQPQTMECIQSWLVLRLVRELQIDPREVDVRKNFSRYGLDSLAKIAIVCDLEDRLGRRLPDTLVDDYPTIEALARYLVEGPDGSDKGRADVVDQDRADVRKRKYELNTQTQERRQ